MIDILLLSILIIAEQITATDDIDETIFHKQIQSVLELKVE